MDTQSPPFFVPFSRPDLIGREEDVERLHKTLQNGKAAAVTPTLALTGQGGIGKTQLAVLYAHEKGGAYPGGVFWLNAARDAEPITGQLGRYALAMKLADPSAEGEVAEYYRQLALVWCGQRGSRSDTLLIADNVDDRAFLTSDLPGLPSMRVTSLGCKVLITSRLANLPGCADLEVSILDQDEARDLILRESGRAIEQPDDQAALHDLGRLVGRLPLALRLVGAILKDSDRSIRAVLDSLRQEEDVIAAIDQNIDALPDDYRARVERSLRGVLKWTWDSLVDVSNETARTISRDMFKALGAFPETAIVRLGLLRWLAHQEPDQRNSLRDPFALAIRALTERNLVERVGDEHVRLHPLIHKYASTLGDQSLRDAVVVRAAERLRSAEFLGQQDADSFLTLLRELPMLEALAGAGDAKRDLARLRRCLDLQAHHLRAGWEPLPHLHYQATLLGDATLAADLERAITAQGTPYLRLRWSTAGSDPAELRVLQGHEDDVRAVALSADGQVALSGSDDQTVRVWDTASGACRAVLEGHKDGVLACALSSGGEVALSGSYDGTVRVWDAASGACRAVLEGHKDRVLACALSSDGRVALSGSDDETVRVWDTASGVCRAVLENYKEVLACALSSDGQVALSTSLRTLRVWDTASGVCRAELKGYEGAVLKGHEEVLACALSSDGQVALSGSKGGTLRVWDIASGACRAVLEGHKDGVLACALSSDGQVALSGSDDWTVRVWDTVSGACVVAMQVDRSIEAAALSADSRYALTGDDPCNMSFFEIVR